MRLGWAQGEDCDRYLIYDLEDPENESKHIWTPEFDHKDRLRFDWDNCSVGDFLQEICNLVNKKDKVLPTLFPVGGEHEKVPLTLTTDPHSTTPLEIIQKLNDIIGYLNIISGQINRSK